MSENSASMPADKESPEARLWRNKNFNMFWSGQTLSALGDAFAIIALPLLVLQATGSVAQMGLVTGIAAVGSVVMGIFAGVIVDRVNRQRLMVYCDVLRAVLYFSIPLCWWWFGAQLWLIYVTVALGSGLGMIFNVAYVTAVANLVDKDQITEANGRIQVTFAIAYVAGPMLAGMVSASLGSTFAISIDALSFVISACSLCFVRLRPVSAPLDMPGVEPLEQAVVHNVRQNFLAGFHFLWSQPTLRALTILLSFVILLAMGAMDLFIFHIKHDLRQGDTVVGIVLGLTSLGSLLAGLAVSRLRKYLGFGVCWLGGNAIAFLALALIGLSSNLWLIATLAMIFTLSSTVASISSISLRQQITPDHLLGRVTSAFWTIHYAPGPVGAALFTALSEHFGTPSILALIGGLGLLLMAGGVFTPARQRHPELAASVMHLPEEPSQWQEDEKIATENIALEDVSVSDL